MTENFWTRVLDLLDRQGMSRKEFTIRVGISYSSIHNGAMLGSIPSADIALRIAYELKTSVEYLVYGSEQPIADIAVNLQAKNKDRFLYEKNKQLLLALEKMQPQVRQSVQDLIFTLGNVSSI